MLQQQGPIGGGRGDRRPRRRMRANVLAGLAMLLAGAPVLFVVAAVADAGWALLGGLAMVVVGLLLVGQPGGRGRNTHGTRIWENDGLPGGGTGAM